MIKGDIEEITLSLNSEEVSSLIEQYNKQEVINIMGKRYFIGEFDCSSPCRFTYSGYRKTKVTIKVRAIKKG